MLKPLSRRGLAAAVLIVLSTVAISEIAVRLLAKGLDDETIASTRLALRQFDPVLGWANRPHARGTRTTSEFSYSVRVNADGLRGPEISRERTADRLRIAVLGDSFAWGWGVAEEDSFPARLERLMPRTEVLNFGVVGHGPVQHLLQVDRVLSFHPDLVVIAVCLGNDFADTVLYRRYNFFKPYARIGSDDRLEIAGYPLPEARNYPTVFENGPMQAMQSHSHLFRLGERITLALRSALVDPAQRGTPISESQHEIYLSQSHDAARQAIEITARVLEDLVARFAAKGVPVVLAAVPTKCELGACFREPPHERGGALKALRQALQRTQVPLVDAVAEFDLSDYWLRDAHWRPSGHAKLARALAETINQRRDALFR